MHNVRTENVQEHSLQVAMVAHALALIKNKFFGGTLNPDRIATMAIFHEMLQVPLSISVVTSRCMRSRPFSLTKSLML